MDIRELEKLAVWYIEHFGQFDRLFKELINPIQHNATHQEKVAVEEPLNNLIAYLRRMDFDVLSLEQLKLLDRLGADAFIGPEGAAFVDATVRTANYDPNTASAQLSEAHGKLRNVQSHLTSFLESLDHLDIRHQEQEECDFITIRVSFQKAGHLEEPTDFGLMAT